MEEVLIEQHGTALYRHFDKADALLYVGISLSALTRLEQHRACSGWFSEIRKITIEYFPSRAEAFAAETKAIQEERPKHNVMMTAKAAEIMKNGHARARSKAEESRLALLKQIVSFQPMYKIPEAGEILRIGQTAVRRLIEENQIGYVDTPTGRRITGWQVIDYIEALQAKYEVE